METESKKPLLGLSLSQLSEVAVSLGMPKFAGRQMARWLYVHHVTDIGGMTDLSKAGRERLSEEYEVGVRTPIVLSNRQTGFSRQFKCLRHFKSGLCFA